MRFAALFLVLTVGAWAVIKVQKIRPDEPPLVVHEIPVKFVGGPEQTVAGQIFVRTKGGETYKMSGVSVGLYPVDTFIEYERWVKSQGKRRFDYYRHRLGNLQSAGEYSRAVEEIECMARVIYDNWAYLPPTPFATKTDADGRFSILVKATGPFVVVARTTRRVADKTERYVWTVRDSEVEGGQLLLSNENMRGIL